MLNLYSRKKAETLLRSGQRHIANAVKTKVSGVPTTSIPTSNGDWGDSELQADIYIFQLFFKKSDVAFSELITAKHPEQGFELAFVARLEWIACRRALVD
ncbi:MAG: hypothetical protein CMM01_26675 [Rhodopirellula sp.]|nr:hypothetical protein [Rhodopirellula sp.]